MIIFCLFWVLWNVAFLIYDLAVGSYGFAAIMAAFPIFSLIALYIEMTE